MSRPLVVVGDALLDRDVDGRAQRLCPDAPAPVLDDTTEVARPGGAALAAALAADGGRREVVLLTALGGPAGAAVAGLLDAAGVEVVDLGLPGDTPEKVRYRVAGQVLLRLDRGGAPAPTTPAPAAGRTIGAAGAVLVADYGRGVAAHPDVRAALGSAASPVVWDPHPRGPAPVAGAALVTPNAAELLGEAGADASIAAVHAAASAARDRWGAAAVAATLGRRGALLADGGDGPPLAVPARALRGPVDTCGAGDRFASAAAVRLGEGAVLSEAVVDAVAAATDFVAAGGASAWRPTPPPTNATAPLAPDPRDVGGAAARLAARRRQGATVVATGGCFDLFHAGHVHLLEAAARLGDALVVCVNSDASVRALKGPERPVVPEADRVAVLRALGCVDEVVCFDDPTPAAVLGVLRPDVFVKGGDYTGRPIAESDVLARWGGQAVTVPYLGGRSTTGLLAAVLGEG
ncbi:MAG TPA: PfkB family carbohydrate kinase [Acidimicrobiales bacterium]|nr:PfkB family carbohydrate kinase [Acidimicrobiales bacterium]